MPTGLPRKLEFSEIDALVAKLPYCPRKQDYTGGIDWDDATDAQIIGFMLRDMASDLQGCGGALNVHATIRTEEFEQLLKLVAGRNKPCSK